MIERNCKRCDVSFTIANYRAKTGQGIYCSISCAVRKPFNRHSMGGDVVRLYHKEKEILIDREDLEKISSNYWCVNGSGYVMHGAPHVQLHHLIMGKPPDGMVTDHINRNRLDNRRCNLRFATKQVNGRNSASKNKYGYPGITKNPHSYMVTIIVNQVRMHIGSYAMLEDAIEARKEAEIKYWGESYN